MSPLVPAIFGLIGVLVGGVLNGLVNWVLERWKQRDETRALTRVLLDELGRSLSGIHVARNDDEPYALRLIDVGEWEQHRLEMGRLLRKDADWESVSAAYDGLGLLRAAAPANAGERAFLKADDDIAKAVESFIKEALDVLERHAKPRRARTGSAGADRQKVLDHVMPPKDVRETS